MAVIKITKKENLDTLVAKITLRLGHKPTQQEVVDFCIELGHDHIDTIVSRLAPVPILDDSKINAIMALRKRCAQEKWYPTEKGQFMNQEDLEIYSL